MSCALWSLQAFHGAEVVAAFSVMSQLAVFPLVFGSTFLSTLFLPIAFHRAGDMENSERVGSAHKILGYMTGMYIAGALVIILVFSFLHHSLLQVISNTRFTGFSYLLPWLTAAWMLYYLGQVLSSFGFLANQSRCYIGPKLVSATIAGISTFYLSGKIGPVGVVCGLAVAGFVYMIWCAEIVRKLVSRQQYCAD